MKTIIATLTGIFFFAITTFAQNKTEKWAEVRIKSSIVCSMCKEKIERELAFTKGVKKSVVDIKKNEIFIVYNNKKTTAEALKIAITKIGYRADDLPADPKAFEKLDECCKSPEGCKDK